MPFKWTKIGFQSKIIVVGKNKNKQMTVYLCINFHKIWFLGLKNNITKNDYGAQWIKTVASWCCYIVYSLIYRTIFVTKLHDVLMGMGGNRQNVRVCKVKWYTNSPCTLYGQLYLDFLEIWTDGSGLAFFNDFISVMIILILVKWCESRPMCIIWILDIQHDKALSTLWFYVCDAIRRWETLIKNNLPCSDGMFGKGRQGK